jgi:pimeloyl-ACP methyl ester carboxylesterase
MNRRVLARPDMPRRDRGRGWTGGDAPHDLLLLPQGYESGYRYPLIVWLTDQGARGKRRFDLGRVMSRVSLRNFVAVQPLSGQATDVERGVWRAIDRAVREASIHPERIYLVGESSAGTEAFRIGCRHPRAFAGVASLGGGFPLGEAAFAGLGDVRSLPMLLCCSRTPPLGSGLDDASIDRTLRLFHAAGASLAMRIYAGKRPLSRAILGDVNRWIMDDICGTSTLPIPSMNR